MTWSIGTTWNLNWISEQPSRKLPIWKAWRERNLKQHFLVVAYALNVVEGLENEPKGSFVLKGWSPRGKRPRMGLGIGLKPTIQQKL